MYICMNKHTRTYMHICIYAPIYNINTTYICIFRYICERALKLSIFLNIVRILFFFFYCSSCSSSFPLGFVLCSLYFSKIDFKPLLFN